MKKIVLVLLVTVMVLSFAGCGEDETVDKTASSDVAVETTVGSEENIRSEFMSFMNEYEAFIDEYVEFMNKYAETDGTDAQMIADYTEYVADYSELSAEFEEWSNKELSVEELDYFTEVQTRVAEKMQSVTVE